MADTAQLNLPLLSPSQAQKHVTVNEALTRLDGMVQLRLQSISQPVPPAVFVDGDCFGVPAGATGDWTGHEGAIAIGANGGWDFVEARPGFRAQVLDLGVPAVHDGVDWRPGALSLTPSGAGMNVSSVEINVTLPAAGSYTTPDVIPERAIVFGVTGLVTAPISGAGAWRIGVAGDDTRYGSGLGVAQNSWLSGPSSPIVYWAPTGLLITSEDTDFAGGALRLSVHFATLGVPQPI